MAFQTTFQWFYHFHLIILNEEGGVKMFFLKNLLAGTKKRQTRKKNPQIKHTK